MNTIKPEQKATALNTSRLALTPVGEHTKLTMSFSAKAQTFMTKVLSSIMGFMVKGSMKKAVLKDLNDIKSHLEAQ